ncbi:MAG TPA: hypothetical protein VIJ79_17990 [Acidobacteriaceae bacterium]
MQANPKVVHEIWRWAGVVGDAFNLAGSVTLAFEMLYRSHATQHRREKLATAKTAAEGGTTLVGSDNRPETLESIETREAQLATRLGWIGVGLLVFGFAILLVCKLLAPAGTGE